MRGIEKARAGVSPSWKSAPVRTHKHKGTRAFHFNGKRNIISCWFHDQLNSHSPRVEAAGIWEILQWVAQRLTQTRWWNSAPLFGLYIQFFHSFIDRSIEREEKQKSVNTICDHSGVWNRFVIIELNGRLRLPFRASRIQVYILLTWLQITSLWWALCHVWGQTGKKTIHKKKRRRRR